MNLYIRIMLRFFALSITVILLLPICLCGQTDASLETSQVQASTKAASSANIERLKAQIDTTPDPIFRTKLILKIGTLFRTEVGQLDSAKHYRELGLSLARQYGMDDMLSQELMYQAVDAQNRQEWKTADSLFLAAEEIIERIDHQRGKAIVKYQRGILALVQGKSFVGIQRMVEAKNSALENDIASLTVAFGISIAKEYNKLSLPERALRELRAVKSYSATKGIARKVMLEWFRTFGHTAALQYNNHPDTLLLREAHLLVDHGINVADSLQSRTIMAELRLAKMQLLQCDSLNHSQLPSLIDSVYLLGQELQDDYLQHQSLLRKQEYLLLNDQTRAAYALNQRVLTLSSQLNESQLHEATYEMAYRTAKAMDKSAEALIYHEKFQTLYDSLNAARKNQLYLEIFEKYENEKKQRQIEQLNQQQDRLKLRGIIIAGLFILAGLIGSLLYYRKQKKLATTEAAAATMKQQLLRAQMNPHFIFNALNSIKRLYVEGRTEEANDFLSDFSRLLRQILERSHQPNVPIEQEVDFLRLYLDLEQRRLGERLHYSVHFNPEEFDFDDTLPSLLLQPLVENSIWHGIMKTNRPGNIQIKVLREAHKIRCIVEDNGIGYYASQALNNQQHESRGMSLIKNRIGEMGEVIIRELTDTEGRVAGTQVELSIPHV